MQLVAGQGGRGARAAASRISCAGIYPEQPAAAYSLSILSSPPSVSEKYGQMSGSSPQMLMDV